MDMNPILLHRQYRRSTFWIAFITALAIHLGAVALAKNKSTATKPECFTAPAAVDVIDAAEPESVLEESVTPPPLEQIRADEESFPEENPKPLPVRPHRRAGPVSLVRGTTTASLRS